MKDHVTIRLMFIGIVALVCCVASALVFGLVHEREQRFNAVQTDVGNTWGTAQRFLGPVLVFSPPASAGSDAALVERYVLPRTLTIDTVLAPEVRTRGIFKKVVYTEHMKVAGTFRTDGIDPATYGADPTLAVWLSDTRSIPSAVALSWNDAMISFEPGPGRSLFEGSGIHTAVPIARGTHEYRFSFEVAVRGSDTVDFVPVGDETQISVASPWQQPQFVGAFLPAESTIDQSGFSASWHVSSFGRGYPGMWDGAHPVPRSTLLASALGVRLYEGVDQYTQVARAVKYAILFIVVTFAVFFLYEVLVAVRVHPVQYFLIGAALALFYLMILSLTEHIGFFLAYVTATILAVSLVAAYSVSVLKERMRAAVVSLVLIGLYGYLYVVLKLEDYALLFGTVLMFVLLSAVMYATRRIDWYALSKPNEP